MKELIDIWVTDGQVFLASDCEFQEKWDKELFDALVTAIRDGGPQYQHIIQLLESARREARYDTLHLHPELERALVLWRREKASELEVSPFVILHQSVLLRIADTLPQSKEALLEIRGFGPNMYRKYGAEILDIVKDAV